MRGVEFSSGHNEQINLHQRAMNVLSGLDVVDPTGRFEGSKVMYVYS